MILIEIICFLSLGYLLFAFICLEKFHQRRKSIRPSTSFRPAVTVFKPVCGFTPELENNLMSFCRQDYPEYQIIFGVNDENDTAIPVLKKIMDEHPEIDITLIVNPHLSGKNYKVSNLINMYPHARHDMLVIADDDMHVPENYLAEIVAPFADPDTGIVTCLYSGMPKGGLLSSLHAMFINEWLLPSVLVSHALGKNNFCFGATMVIKRDTLAQIGGFEILADYLADDYMLGKLVAEHGYKIHQSHLVVQNTIQRSSFKSILLNEIRWARTMRAMEPVGYAFTFLTDTLVISCITAAVLYFQTRQLFWPLVLAGVVLLIRTLFHLRATYILDGRYSGLIWQVPARDFLNFFIRMASFSGNRIEWKSRFFSVDNDGLLYSPDKPPIITPLTSTSLKQTQEKNI